MLSGAEVARTVAALASVQEPDGFVPWTEGGSGDPWNHVEAAMALTLGGRRAEAERAYAWLAASQHGDGSWCNYYRAGVAVDRRLDTNVCAYVATGVWQHFLATADTGFLEALFPVVERAIGFSLARQLPAGGVRWSVDPDGTPAPDALLAGSASILLSVRCALAAAGRLGIERPHWAAAAGRLEAAVATEAPGAFAPKHRFAMDWYYPVLCGAVRGEAARERLLARWSTFVMDGLGVRCVSDQPWVTAAETAECALALDACGMTEEAILLLDWVEDLRSADGLYWTGCVHPQRVHYPGDERTTYSAAAVVLASYALADTGPAAGMFRAGFGAPGRPGALSGSRPAEH